MHVVLGSQSPRRRELLSGIVRAEGLRVLPPDDDQEPGFDDVFSPAAIEQRLQQVVQLKHDNVFCQLQRENPDGAPCLICADTIVVVSGSDHGSLVLGKPPAEDWQSVVRTWFRQYYAGRRHEVWTGCLISCGGESEWLVVKTGVQMYPLDRAVIDWYVSTGEPVGKAGGYGIQGQAAVFIRGIEGSLSSVIGLPVLEVRGVLKQMGVDVR